MINHKFQLGISSIVTSLFLWLLIWPLTSCHSQSTSLDIPPSQRAVVQAQLNRQRDVEVVLEAPVVAILPDDTEGLQHQRFILGLANGTTVLVAHDISMAPRVPVQIGSQLKIQGQYIWNHKGGLIHWTHHSDNSRHQGGWIELDGQIYR